MPLPNEVATSAVIVVATNNVTTPGAMTAVMAAVSGKTNYAQGFEVTGSGANTGVVINVTVTGTTNTLNYAVQVVGTAAGPMNALGGLKVRFPEAIPASATNTAITLTVPSFGTGATEQSATIYGYYV